MRLQASPLGLLELFRLKQEGKNPPDFGERVEPSVDVTDFYGTVSTVNASQAAAAGAIGNGAAATRAVEARRYLSLSGSLTVGAAAGTWLGIAVGYQDAQNVAVYIATVNIAAPIAGATYRVAGFCRGLVLPPGTRPVLEADGNAGGADHVATIDYSYQRLDGLP